jgi:ADP-ribose pyrophosphatase YjhB (NUDIX family)
VVFLFFSIQIHRINLDKEEGGQEYYVIPGGTVEPSEEIEEAVVREMKEETDVNVKVERLFFEMEDKNPRGRDRKHYYYICTYLSGEPKLREDSEEAEEMKQGIHFYKPMWVELEKVKDLTLFPAFIKEKILEFYK